MNLILYVVAASSFVNLVNSEKNVEEETEEIKRNLEQFKVKLESLKQKVAGQSLLQNKFGTAVADGAKFIETLSDILKVFRQQKTDNEKGKTELGKTVEQKTEETEKTTPKEKLKWVQKKVQEVITKLGASKSKAKSDHRILTQITFALRYAGQLNEALDVSLKFKEKDMNIINVINFADELSRSLQNIGNSLKFSENLQEAKELQQSAFSIVTDISTTLNDLQDGLNTYKYKLKVVKEKLQDVITTLEAIEKEANPSGYLVRYIILTLRYASQLSEALDVALKVEEKNVNTKNVINFAGELHRTIQNIGSYTEHAKYPEKVKDLQQSAFNNVEEISTTLKDLRI